MPDQALLEQRCLGALTAILESQGNCEWREISVVLDDGKASVRATGAHVLVVEIRRWGSSVRTAVACSSTPEAEKTAEAILGIGQEEESIAREDSANGVGRAPSVRCLSG